MVVRNKGRVVREQFSVDLASGFVQLPIQRLEHLSNPF